MREDAWDACHVPWPCGVPLGVPPALLVTPTLLISMGVLILLFCVCWIFLRLLCV